MIFARPEGVGSISSGPVRKPTVHSSVGIFFASSSGIGGAFMRSWIPRSIFSLGWNGLTIACVTSTVWQSGF